MKKSLASAEALSEIEIEIAKREGRATMRAGGR